MSITVNVVGQTNIVTSITNSDTVDVALGTMVAQTLTSLAIAGGANVTVTTTSGVFTIIGRDVPVSSVNGQTGAVALSVTDISAASAVHTHVAADVTNFATEAAKYGPVTSVVGKTGAVTLSAAEVGAASASHTHVAANVTDFAAEAAKHGPVSSVAGKTGTVTLTASDVGAASASHTHVASSVTDFAAEAAKYGPVSSVNGSTGTVTLVSTDVSAASAVHTHVAADVTDFATEAAKYGPVSSVNGSTGTVVLSAADVTAASATHAHNYVQSLNDQTGMLSIVAGDNVTVATSSGSITISAAAGTSGGSVASVNGQTGTVTLVSTDVSAASAVHTHVAADVTDFAAEAAKYGPVSSVNGSTGTVVLSAADVTAASATHAHEYVQALNAQTGSLTVVGGDNITVSTSAGFITISGAAAGTAGSSVTSVNEKTGAVTLSATDVSAASAVHSHVASEITDLTSVANVVSVAGKTGAVTLVATDVSAERRLTWGVVSIDNTSATLEHNVDFGTARVIRVGPITEGNYGATGAANGSEGAHYRLINSTTITEPTLAFTLVYESTSSDSTNRFHTVDGLDRVLGPQEQAEILYDPYINRWRVTPCCGGGY